MVNTSELVAISRSGQPQANLCSYFFEFGRERRSQEEVKQWYQSLQDGQLPTEFVSIAYMKDQGTNFEHEFLLIYLASKDEPNDYSFVCRVERTGNGSRTQALFNGDYSHDTVQIFSRDAYTSFQRSYPCPVRCVLVIQFPQRLDLLRVLELCYSLQESDTSARYTLFQFNCYFMCWMILVNLVRGIDKWNNRLDTDTWGSIVRQRLPQLIDTWVVDNAPASSQCTCNHLPTSSHSASQTPSNSIAQHLCFCIIKVALGPQSDRVVRTITESTQAELESARNQLIEAIESHNSANLFPSDTQLYEAVRQGLSVHLSAAATRVLHQDKYAGHRLWSLLSDCDSSHGGSSVVFSTEFEARIAKKLHKLWFDHVWDYLGGEEFRSKVQREAPTSGPSQFSLNQYFELVPLVPQLRIWRESYERAVGEILGSCPNGTRKSMLNPSYLNFKHWEFYRKRILSVVLSDRADIQTVSQAISQDYRILAMYTLLHLETPVNPQACLRRYFKSSDWSYCLNKCIAKAIYDSLIPLDKPLLRVEIVSGFR
ncbi:hypothetical protein ACGC1H_004641 [Rhizoctonia solani]